MPLILLNKPFRVLSQFTDPQGRQTLANFIEDRTVYPAGRLDFDSEGLIALTDDGRLAARISQAGAGARKSYWVQVEGELSAQALETLRQGVELKDGLAHAVGAERIDKPSGLWRREPPIRQRKHIPTAWLSMTIDEGRNRQVRRMCAAAGLPCLRLIRYQIGPWALGKLEPGASRSMSNQAAWSDLAA
jgi:23S rRNA pseudouridine2457 synthase